MSGSQWVQILGEIDFILSSFNKCYLGLVIDITQQTCQNKPNKLEFDFQKLKFCENSQKKWT